MCSVYLMVLRCGSVYCKYLTFSMEFMHKITMKILLILIYFCCSRSKHSKTVKNYFSTQQVPSELQKWLKNYSRRNKCVEYILTVLTGTSVQLVTNRIETIKLVYFMPSMILQRRQSMSTIIPQLELYFLLLLQFATSDQTGACTSTYITLTSS